MALLGYVGVLVAFGGSVALTYLGARHARDGAVG